MANVVKGGSACLYPIYLNPKDSTSEEFAILVNNSGTGNHRSITRLHGKYVIADLNNAAETESGMGIHIG